MTRAICIALAKRHGRGSRGRRGRWRSSNYSSSGGSTSDSEDLELERGDEAGDMPAFQSSAVDFSGFSFKNLSQLAFINTEILERRPSGTAVEPTQWNSS
ncbi:hypothetical protein CLOM_g21229 [Closterium sp. NIES-68]|nr:hypothetical protein CLOM_g21229 [Closterium sp. NIES-68]